MGRKDSDDEKPKMGWVEGQERDETTIVRAVFRSKRIGSDGRTRTFHINARGIKRGSALSAVDYIARSGVYAAKGEDLQSTSGRSLEEMKALLAHTENGTKRKNGRVAVSIVFEFPDEMPAKSREAVAEKLTAHLEGQGYPTHWAIHTSGESGSQPHVHFVTTARPFKGGLIVPEGAPNKPTTRLLKDRKEVKKLRRLVADIINDEQERSGGSQRFHPGKLRETGITRPALPRVRSRLWQSNHHDSSEAHDISRRIIRGRPEDFEFVFNSRNQWASREREKRQLHAGRRAARLREKAQLASVRADAAEKKLKGYSAVRLQRPPTSKQIAWIEDVARRTGVEPPEIVWRDGGEGMAWINNVAGSGAAESAGTNAKQTMLATAAKKAGKTLSKRKAARLNSAMKGASQLLNRRSDPDLTPDNRTNSRSSKNRRQRSISDE